MKKVLTAIALGVISVNAMANGQPVPNQNQAQGQLQGQLQGQTQSVGGQANTQSVGGQANTQSVGGQANTSSFSSKSDTIAFAWAQAPINISECMTASHAGFFQWAGVNKSCLAEKLSYAIEYKEIQIMLRCSIPTYRDAVAFEIVDGKANRIKTDKQEFCIEREVSLMKAQMVDFEKQVNKAIETELAQHKKECAEKINRCEAAVIK